MQRAHAAGLTVVAFTNGDEEQQRAKLARTGLADAVDHLIASSTLSVGKPDPRAFAEAIDLLGVAPAEALMVGDSLEIDARGALAAGLDAVLLDRNGAHPDLGAEVPRIRSLDELRW